MAKKLSFEQSMDRLEEIVNVLERGDAPLDESLALFQEGAKLIKGCTEALDKAQQQVALLTKADDGPTEEPFAGAED